MAIFGVIIAIFIGIFLIGYNQSLTTKHDFSGDLDREREDYEMSILKLIDDVKSVFTNKK